MMGCMILKGYQGAKLPSREEGEGMRNPRWNGSNGGITGGVIKSFAAVYCITDEVDCFRALLHLPLASIFSPILALPDNMNRLLSPSLNLLSAYKASFVEGGQARNLTRFVETVRNNGAGEMVGKINTFIEKRVQEGREKREEMMKQRQERMKEVGKEVEGKGEERQ